MKRDRGTGVLSHELEEYDEQLVRRLIEKVTIFDDRFIVDIVMDKEWTPCLMLTSY